MAYPMGARMMSGQSKYHEQLESELAPLRRRRRLPPELRLPGMVSIIDSLVDRHDVWYNDSEAHACILDGLRLHIGSVSFTPQRHGKVRGRPEACPEIADQTARDLVITEGVYGMAGDLGNLSES